MSPSMSECLVSISESAVLVFRDQFWSKILIQFSIVSSIILHVYSLKIVYLMPDLQIQSFIRHKNNLYEIEIVLGLRKPIGLIFVEKKNIFRELTRNVRELTRYFRELTRNFREITRNFRELTQNFSYIYTCKRGMFLIYKKHFS